MISMTSSRRSARLSAELTKLTTSPDAPLSRRLESPLVAAGSVTPTIRPMIATTTTISISVTPLFPADDIRVQAFASGLAVQTVGNNVRFITVVAGVLVHIRVSPGIHRDVFIGVRSVPVLHVTRLGSQGSQSLLGRRK